MDLQAVLAHDEWAPRGTYPASTRVTDRLFSVGDGFYLFTHPLHYGDRVGAVGWAESAYWAFRCWSRPSLPASMSEFSEPPAPDWRTPSLVFLGRPSNLSFSSLFAFESAQPQAPAVPQMMQQSLTADHSCIHSMLIGGVIDYYFEAFSPSHMDEPVAMRFQLRRPRQATAN
jgi:hypothetical protein